MKAIALCLLIVAALIQGCATKMTAEGARVRQITPNEISLCKFLAVVEGANYMGNTMGHDQQGALNEVRNKVAELGGNAFVVMHGDSDMIGSVVQAEAYSCSDTRDPSDDEPAKVQKL